MAQILTPDGKLKTDDAGIMMPPIEIPSFRTHVAIQKGVEKNILIRTMGGIGDYITAEPAIRYAINKFEGSNISVATECPDLFGHLKLAKLYDLMRETPKWEDYLVFKSLWDPEHLHGEFVAQMLVQCVDYSSISMWRCQLPVADRSIVLIPSEKDNDLAKELINPETDIVVHAGRSWPSKTFPESWWNDVIAEIIRLGFRPVLIGFDFATDRGAVSVNAEGCLDLRNKCSRMQTVAILQRTRVFLTNDSAPLHMAASGDAWIGLVSTAKHPDFVTHWRNGQWGWRMKSMGRGSLWDVCNLCPSFAEKVDFGTGEIEKYLPDPKAFALWGVHCHF